ncbi:MAG: hypothetical protein WKF82_08115 [Nocardioidaceae bacterium]
MWSLVIAKDLFSAFDANDLLDPTTAKRYRNTVLAPGGAATRPIWSRLSSAAATTSTPSPPGWGSHRQSRRRAPLERLSTARQASLQPPFTRRSPSPTKSVTCPA